MTAFFACRLFPAVALLAATLAVISLSADEPAAEAKAKQDEVKKDDAKQVDANKDGAKKDEGIVVSDGRIHLTPAANWVRRKPRTRIVEHEFAAPAAEGDEADARITVMGAGGSIEQNIDRWIGQFTQPDGKSTRGNSSVKQLDVAGQKVHLVDISGTYRDQLGPFAKATYRKDYRLLGAIIVTEKMGRYYVKMVGPKKTVDANAKAFTEVIESMQIKGQ